MGENFTRGFQAMSICLDKSYIRFNPEHKLFWTSESVLEWKPIV